MIQELRDKRNKLLHDAQALLLKPEVTAEELVSAKRMSDDADALESRIAQLESVAGKIAEDERANPAPPRGSGSASQDQGGNPGVSEQRKAFSDYIRFGKRSKVLKSVDTRDLTTADFSEGSGGAAFIPEEFYPVLTSAEKAWGAILQELGQRETNTGAPMKISFDNDTANELVIDTEPSTPSEVDPSLSSELLAVDNLKTGIVKVSIQELQDSAFDIDAFIRNKFGKRYYRGLTDLVTNGSFAGSPPVAQNIESLLDASTLGATSASANAIAWSDIASLYGALDPAYEADAIFSFNSQTRAKLLGVTDSLGRPLYIPAPTAASFDMILGKRVVLNQSMPSVGASNVSVLYGDFKQGYLLRQVKPGLAIIRLNERFMDTLEVGFLGYVRAGGISTDAGTHPIVNLTQHS